MDNSPDRSDKQITSTLPKITNISGEQQTDLTVNIADKFIDKSSGQNQQTNLTVGITDSSPDKSDELTLQTISTTPKDKLCGQILQMDTANCFTKTMADKSCEQPILCEISGLWRTDSANNSMDKNHFKTNEPSIYIKLHSVCLWVTFCLSPPSP